MAQFTKRFPDLTFTGASTTSNAITLLDDCRSLGLAITATGTLTVQVEPTDTGTGWVILQSAGADVVSTGGKGLVIEPQPFRQLRLLGTAGSTGSSAVVVGVIVV